MAGTYPDIPGTRFALDQDGTVCQVRDYTASSAWIDVTSQLANSMEVETGSYINITISGNGNYAECSLGFPEARSLSGVYLHASAGAYAPNSTTWEWSSDTTDGTDGSWSSVAPSFSYLDSHNQSTEMSTPYFRSDIAALSLTGVKGIRVRFNGGYQDRRLHVLHLYGSRPVTGVDRLEFWDSNVDQIINPAQFDFGDHPQGTSTTRQFRIKNLSGSLTANTINVAVSDLESLFGSTLEISTDGTNFLPSVSIGNLAPGAISSSLYVRRSVPPAAATTQRVARLLANADSWS